ncbi:MAG: LacI family DNA-binding transcriptional regulator [Lachnospiraceae bacterium]|nr:LacI family DNA-binding transcriptional regulator [Lachnospiraceae bacterium]
MNISEFSKLAGVSKSAVSRYFNDGYLSNEKKAKIEAAIQKTGYSPSLTARAVKTRVTKLVGVILPKLSSESCSRITEGIDEILEAEGYKLLLVNTANNSHKEIESLELFRQNRVDGVILLGTVFTELHKSVLKKMHVPVVIVGQRLKGYNCICHNDEGAARALTKLMLERGAKRPAIIGVTPEDKAAGKARLDGFLRALAEFQILPGKNTSEVAEFTMDSGYDRARHLYSHAAEKPDCLFCATDDIAAGAMLYLRDAGLRVPEDVMVCGIGDTKLAKNTYCPLTTARLHYKTAGIEAANMLLSAIRHGDKIQRTLQLDYDIVERQSTKRETV